MRSDLQIYSGAHMAHNNVGSTLGHTDLLFMTLVGHNETFTDTDIHPVLLMLKNDYKEA